MSAFFTQNSCQIFPLGDTALTIEFGNEISPELNDKAVKLAQYFEENRFAGLIETVPAYCSVSLFYDVFAVRKKFSEFPTAFEAVKYLAAKALQNLVQTENNAPRLIEIPVNFSEDFALDLEFIASQNNLTKQKVIKIFTAKTYRVFMLGFLPAFAYMGEVDERIAAPRKQSPRLIVPRGSVGIAGKQTGIYPFDSPGGWQIIGRTDFELFTPNAENPCALQAGDLVKFYASNK
ncbi:MAG TPA: 5-oxoprolinase subunit PxpB [Pyrinomonadaceae bacterium]|nr:5-oxoprolinase subunit PxpB [Pyrinomonadaceae bacterium]